MKIFEWFEENIGGISMTTLIVVILSCLGMSIHTLVVSEKADRQRFDQQNQRSKKLMVEGQFRELLLSEYEEMTHEHRELLSEYLIIREKQQKAHSQ